MKKILIGLLNIITALLIIGSIALAIFGFVKGTAWVYKQLTEEEFAVLLVFEIFVVPLVSIFIACFVEEKIEPKYVAFLKNIEKNKKKKIVEQKAKEKELEKYLNSYCIEDLIKKYDK